MGRKLGIALIVAGGAGLALLVGPDGPLGGAWRPAPMHPAPAGPQLAGLAAASIVEAVGFGLALATLVLGRPAFVRLAGSPVRGALAWVAGAWLLGSWWPHSALHRHFGLRLDPLVGIELAFHAGSVLAAAVLIGTLVSRARSGRPEPTGALPGTLPDALSSTGSLSR